jgi:murein DD-endopeptidase MepM/ murein hydrolase activator NlpD
MRKLGCAALLFGLAVFGWSVPGRKALRYVFDFTAPQVQVHLERDLFGRTITLPFTASDAHPVRLRYHFDDDSGRERRLDVPQSPLVIQVEDLDDGQHVLRLTFTDTSAWSHSTSVEVPIRLDLRTPIVSILSPERIWESRQGDTLLVFARVDKPVVRAELEIPIGNSGRPRRVPGSFFEAAPQVYCLLRPIDIETPPGEYSDRFYFFDAAGNEALLTQRTKILARPIADGEVRLTEAILAKIRCRNLEEQERLRRLNDEQIARKTSQLTEERVFRGPFIRPAAGKWTSPYGQNRKYDGKVWHRHLGMDLADVAGAPVRAANEGIVAVAEPLGIYGNCVILDHGRGIFSLYGHNSVLRVRTGERVAKNQVIAIQGDTGLAGGIHLHFAVIVGTVYVAPDIFIQKFEGFENALGQALGQSPPSADGAGAGR